MQIFFQWLRRHFSDPQVVVLFLFLILGTAGTILLSNVLAPVFASVVIAYLLEGLVGMLERLMLPRIICVLIVFFAFLAFLLFLLIGLLPLLWEQIQQLFQQLPAMIHWGQRELLQLPERYPEFISAQQVMEAMDAIRAELTIMGQRVLSFSLASAHMLVNFALYTVIVPFLVFFFLKDKDKILEWIVEFLPKDRSLAEAVWREVDFQIGNYVRGKAWEILILWAASYITFAILGLEFAMLISLFIGLSVLIPYVGATVMILPVAGIAYFQWGWGHQFSTAIIAYLVLQMLDGNILAPLLFSEVVNIHPVAIIVAILAFGGLWGFWGVFFAIPLATLVSATISALSSRVMATAENQRIEEPPEKEVSSHKAA